MIHRGEHEVEREDCQFMRQIIFEMAKSNDVPIEICPVSFHCNLLIRPTGVIVVNIEWKLASRNRFDLVNSNGVACQMTVSHFAGWLSRKVAEILKKEDGVGALRDLGLIGY